jgi:mono/diheme cytochrome c family protein
VYRGDNLPAELVGNVFIPEPAGNLVRRQVFTEEAGTKSSQNAYDKSEFLASTDERFRPVNMYNSPDGTLYVVDMYRGVIQEGSFVTPYLRKEIKDRGLEQPIGLGRIFRIVHETTQPRKSPALSKASGAELVKLLGSKSGWHRDVAQQLIVQREDKSLVPSLEEMAQDGTEPLGRLHALWTLEGLGRINLDVLLDCLADDNAHVRASAVHLMRQEVLRQPDGFFVRDVLALAGDVDKHVRFQVALTLGLANNPAADAALERIVAAAADETGFLEALLAGFAGQETEFLATRLTLPAWSRQEAWREKVLAASSGMAWRQQQPLAVLRFLHLVGAQPADRAWQQIALLEGINSMPLRAGGGGGGGNRGLPGRGSSRPVTLPTAPAGLEALRKSPDARLAKAAETVAGRLLWPGKDGKPLSMLEPLSAKHQALYDLGRKEYLGLCAGCHHAAGYGDAAKGPPLLDSEWLDNDERLVRLVLYGMRGPITINDEPFNQGGAMEMPSTYTALDDEKIAGILTYIRREWRDEAAPVEAETVARIRAATNGRVTQWTEAELRQVK